MYIHIRGCTGCKIRRLVAEFTAKQRANNSEDVINNREIAKFLYAVPTNRRSRHCGTSSSSQEYPHLLRAYGKRSHYSWVSELCAHLIRVTDYSVSGGSKSQGSGDGRVAPTFCAQNALYKLCNVQRWHFRDVSVRGEKWLHLVKLLWHWKVWYCRWSIFMSPHDRSHPYHVMWYFTNVS